MRRANTCIQIFAMILIAVSAGTIGIISNNETLREVAPKDDLQDLINQSASAAGWLIALSGGLLIGEAVATISAELRLV